MARRSRPIATSRSQRGVTAHAAVHRRRRRCPRPPGTRSSRTSTTTASSTSSSRRATSRTSRTTPKDPSNLLLGQPDGTFSEGAEDAGILSFERGRGAALADLNLDGLLDLVEVNFGAPGPGLAQRRRPAAADDPAPMGHWLGCRARAAGAEPRRDRRLDRGHAPATGSSARADGRRRPRQRRARLDALRARAARPRRGPRHLAGRRAAGRGCHAAADHVRHHRARRDRDQPWTPAA